jgi:hypothetical protein
LKGSAKNSKTASDGAGTTWLRVSVCMGGPTYDVSPET